MVSSRSSASAYQYEQVALVCLCLLLVWPLGAQWLEVWFRSTRRFKLLAFERLSRRATAARMRRSSSSADMESAAAASGGGSAAAAASAVSPSASTAFMPAHVPRVNVAVNYLVGAAHLVNLARCVDPSGSRSVYSTDALHGMGNASGALVLLALLYVANYTCVVGARIAQAPRPSVTSAAAALAAAALAAGAVGTIAARPWTLDAFWARGVFFWACAAALAVATVQVLYGMSLLDQGASMFVEAASLQTRERLPYLVASLRRLRVARLGLFAVDVVALPVLVVAGLNAYRSDEGVRERSGGDDFSRYRLERSATAWSSLAGSALLLWYAWLPLHRDTGREVYGGPREPSTHGGWSDVTAAGRDGSHERGGHHPLSDLDENDNGAYRGSLSSASGLSVASRLTQSDVYH